MKKLLAILALLPSLVWAQYSVPYNPNNVNILGGNINGTVVGGANPLAGSFTSLSSTQGLVLPSVENAVTAFAGGGQTNAVALNSLDTFHRITTVVTSGDSVKLPTAVPGSMHYIRNDSSSGAGLGVYGTSPDTINSVATATGITLTNGMGAWFICTAAGNWTTAAPFTQATGTGSIGVRQTSPTLITPILGVATATSINGNVFTTGSSTYTGTAGQAYTFPTTSATLARIDAANTFVGTQTIGALLATSIGLGKSAEATIQIKHAETTTVDTIANASMFCGTFGNNGDTCYMGFGYANGSLVNPAASIAYTVKNNVGNQAGDIEFYTRSVTTDTAPSLRASIKADGTVNMAGAVTMPGLASSSAATTGTLCWTTGTGNVNVDTTVACLASTIKVKQLVEPLDSGLDTIMRLRPVSYDLKPEFNPEHLGRQVGLIAEEVAEVDKRLVAVDDKGDPRGVRYMQMTAVLVKGMQEQQNQIRYMWVAILLLGLGIIYCNRKH